jgi:chorismate dehydratase
MMHDTHGSISIGRIQYVNVDPVYYNFRQYTSHLNIDIISRPPSKLNQLMAEGNLDISSVSSSAYARNFKDWMILPDLSISCYGKVMSVLMVSRFSFEELDGRTVLLTDESATAADLLKLIFSKKGIHPVFKKGKVTSPNDLKASVDAGLVIGDSALKLDWRRHFDHVWDLCEMWNQMTGLPFVFGVWVVRRSFGEKFPEITAQILGALYRSRTDGLANITSIAESTAHKLGLPIETTREYYSCMTYNLGDRECQALMTFFKGLYDLEIILQNLILHLYEDNLFASSKPNASR